MRALPILLFLAACGSTPPPEPVAPPSPPPPLATVATTCVPADQAPRPDPTSLRGVFGRAATVRIGVSPVVSDEAPAIHVPVGDGERVCRVDYAPACTNAAADQPLPVDASGEVQLGFLRDGAGGLQPIAWYRTVVHGMSAPEETEYGSTQSARCRETVEWVWVATAQGAALVASPQVGLVGEACSAELTTRVHDGLYCLEAAGAGCPQLATPACYRLDGQRLVATDEPAATAAEPAHPWHDPDALPYPSREVVETAIAAVRDPIVRCLPAGGRVGFRLHFDGSGQATVRKLVPDPPLDAAAERCVRDALAQIRHPPFQGSIAITGQAP